VYFRNLTELKGYVAESTFAQSEQLMILVGDKSEDQVHDMMEYLREKKVDFFGGIFAGLIVGARNRREGFIVEKVEPVCTALVFPFMMRLSQDPQSFDGSTALVLVDGLSSRMKDLTDTVYDRLEGHVKYVGGGAGFYDLKHRPCIFTSKGIYEDALFLCILKNRIDLAVEHGWNRLQGPFFVKRSYDNVLSKLEDDMAFGVYKGVIEEEENVILSKEDFFSFAKDHPFGIQQKDGSLIVRDPIAINDSGEIICVASIPEGSDVYVLKGDADTLLASSKTISDAFREHSGGKYMPLLFDCISRAMFLEDRFEEELENIQSSLNYGVQGTLSIGEIAFSENGKLVIHNKSTVLALLNA
jgi:hypothetical protein